METLADKIRELLAAGEGADRDGGERANLRVAVCALLLEMAHVDYDFAPEERETIVVVLRRHFGLDAAQLEELITLSEAERVQYPDLGPFTKAINAAYSETEKFDLLVMLWQVIAADKRLDTYEQLLMRRLQPTLDVTQEMVEKARKLGYETDPLKEPPP